MGEQSKIEWTDHTFNPWVGCEKVSEACRDCYAEAWAKRTGQAALWRGERRRTTAANWNQVRRWNRAAEESGTRPRVFCASLADVFEDHAELEPWRAELWDLIRECSALDWLLLTKRPENIRSMLPEDWLTGWSHVGLGTTVETQGRANERIRHLTAIPAALRFLSCEPLLGPLDVCNLPAVYDGAERPLLRFDALRGGYWALPEEKREHRDGLGDYGPPTGSIHWVIAGGESGARARPSSPTWFRALRDQCERAGVSFHFKQWGEWVPRQHAIHRLGHLPDTRNLATWGVVTDQGRFHAATSPWNGQEDGETRVVRVGKKVAGRELDGLEHDGEPAWQRVTP